MQMQKFPDRVNGEKVILEVSHSRPDTTTIDLMKTGENMMRKKKLYGYLFLAAILIGLATGLVLVAIDHYFGRGSYARALINFQYDGIESGLDPNGAAFDVNKIKSPAVIADALTSLGLSTNDIEAVRANINIEGVIPEDAVERITMINEMAKINAASYEKLLDVTYHPSQYVVYLYDDGTYDQRQLNELLDTILLSYREYFFDTYGDSQTLAVAVNLLNGVNYDYGESIDLLDTQLTLMMNYVIARRDESPDFRASGTGLSFADIVTSLEFVRDVDLARLSSYVESNSLSRDSARQIEYYRYQVREYSNRLAQLQVNLANVTSAIDSYEKDPVVVVSGQDGATEIGQTNEYYDKLIAQKLDLSGQISDINTRINKYQVLINDMTNNGYLSKSADFEYADAVLQNLESTITEWVGLVEDTTEEYYSTTKFSNAYQVAVPSQYFTSGGITGIAKKSLVPVIIALVVVLVIWICDGVMTELRSQKEAE